jgi:cobalt-zinc-cadmium efflux system protein
LHEHAPASAGPQDRPRLGRREQRRRLGWALVLAAIYLGAEVIGGLWTGSLVLLADAGHMLSDVASLGLGMAAIWLADRPSPAARTFGYQRMEILAALVNGVALGVVAVLICIEAVERLRAPPAVAGLPVMLIAVGGLGVNLAGMAILQAGREESLNLRAAWLHLMSDALGSVGAILAGAAIWLFGFRLADPLASLAIALLILHGAWALLRETVDVLLEAAPPHLDVDEIGAALRDVAGVCSVHDLHVWTITSGMVSLSCHVQCAETAAGHAVLQELQAMLRSRFGIEHATVQIEPENFEEAVRVC